MTDTPSPKPRFLLIELTATLACLILTKLLFDPIDWRFAAPMSMGCTIIFIAVMARLRSEPWAAFGLITLPRLKSWLLLLPQAFLCLVAIAAIGNAVTYGGDALGMWDAGVEPEGVQNRFAGITGNLPLYLTWLGISIFSAGFGEEIFFRGYLMRRIEGILPGGFASKVAMVVLPAVFFGAVHFYYQGLQGLLNAGLIGMALGSLYLLYKRNLWPLIIAHALIDSIGMTALYFGVDV
tara:strand:+ start:4877 stop:5587 length:711 start_codon:yes stop_codon:yes gene_type:complete